MEKQMTLEEIREFNNKVEYNNSFGSWIIDIIGCLIAWPTVLTVIYRRCKYNTLITE